MIKYIKYCIALGCLVSVYSSACDDIEYRQFDFWLGKWKVVTPAGKVAGVNEIERKHNGCVITESYSTTSGFSGESLNIYDRQTEQWHQTWADNTGLMLKLTGHFNGTSMVLMGNGQDKQSKKIVHRITWTPNSDGSVRQHWQSSRDEKTWNTVFDGLYTKASKK